jgi:hypothetical protein
MVAEKEGFEPPVPVRAHRISSAARSTTPALLLWTSQDKGFYSQEQGVPQSC